MTFEQIKTAIKHYLYGLFACMWNAGWSGLAAVIGVDGVALTGVSENVRILGLHEMIAGYVGSAILHGVLWIRAHPIDEKLQNDPTI